MFSLKLISVNLSGYLSFSLVCSGKLIFSIFFKIPRESYAQITLYKTRRFLPGPDLGG